MRTQILKPLQQLNANLHLYKLSQSPSITPSRRTLLSSQNQSQTHYQNQFSQRAFTSSSSLAQPRPLDQSLVNPTRPRPKMSTGIPSETAAVQSQADMSSTAGTGSATELGIENKTFNTGAGVDLTDRQRILVGSVLDLFAGKPTLEKLSLWTDDAKFADPLTSAEGRKQYSAQWYGLKAAFSEIERLSENVTSAGNPIVMDLKTRYKVKGLGTEKVIQSVVKIHTEESTGERMKITSVEDRWDGEIPDGAFAKIFRNLNAVTVPAFVSVPKNSEQDAKK